MLESAVFSPGCVISSRHTEKIMTALCSVISGKQRKMIIAPTTGRQRFQFKMAEIRKILFESRFNTFTAVIMDDGPIGVDTSGSSCCFFKIFFFIPISLSTNIFISFIPKAKNLPSSYHSLYIDTIHIQIYIYLITILHYFFPIPYINI